MSQKTYVLDTCVLLADPDALFRFDEHDVVLPLVVIEELDRKRILGDEVGANARSAMRLIESLGASDAGGLVSPRLLDGGGSLRIELNSTRSARLPDVLDPKTPDHRILATCLNLSDQGSGPILVTKDAALRIKGAQLGVEVEDYRADTVVVDEHYTGVAEFTVESGVIDQRFVDGKVALPGCRLTDNQFVVLRGSGSQSGLGRVVDAGPDPVIARVAGSRAAFGVESKNLRQAFALDLLLDPDIPAASMMGTAGTGKTFLALAAGLDQVVEQGRYRKVSVYRPLVPVGRQDIGFLPGDLDEKLAPWMAAVHDALHSLLSTGGAGAARAAVEELEARDQLEMASVTFLRGRSITGEFVIIDEAQNLELSTLKVILTRMGADSKVVFCSDVSQVDNPYVSPQGGMAALVEKFKGVPLFGHVTLQRTVRSPLAELAASTL